MSKKNAASFKVSGGSAHFALTLAARPDVRFDKEMMYTLARQVLQGMLNVQAEEGGGTLTARQAAALRVRQYLPDDDDDLAEVDEMEEALRQFAEEFVSPFYDVIAEAGFSMGDLEVERTAPAYTLGQGAKDLIDGAVNLWDGSAMDEAVVDPGDVFLDSGVFGVTTPEQPGQRGGLSGVVSQAAGAAGREAANQGISALKDAAFTLAAGA